MNNINHANMAGGGGGVNGESNGKIMNDINNWKKQRDMRLKNNNHNRTQSPVAIKIEDDSDEETPETPVTSTHASNVVNGHQPSNHNTTTTRTTVDRAVQTENVLLMQTLKRIVKERMQEYKEAALKDNNIDKQLSPLLEKLQRENDELRKQGLHLRTQLEQKEKEKQTLKRRYGAIENALHAKVTSSVSTAVRSPPPYSSTVGDTNVPNRSPNSMSNGAPRPHINPTGPRLISRPLRPPPPLHSTNQVIYQQPPPVNQSRPPVHMVNPVRQVPPQIPNVMRHPYAPGERFMLVNNQLIPASLNGINNINTQVVPSNQGLRMTSLPPDMTSSVRPVDSHGRIYTNFPPGVDGQLKQIRQVMHPQLRPAQNGVRPPPTQNAVRPFTQPPAQPAVQNVPNIAVPFSSLPKLTANISTSNNAIVLTWDYEKSGDNTDNYKVECYQLFAHQAKDARIKPPSDTKQWKKIGVVNALPLPMACTLTQFASGSVYFFAVVAVDIHGREGEMSNPCVIRLDVNR